MATSGSRATITDTVWTATALGRCGLHSHIHNKQDYFPLQTIISLVEMLGPLMVILSAFVAFSFLPQVSVGLVHGRASHIIWPLNRWQQIKASLPPNRRPVLTQEDEEVD